MIDECNFRHHILILFLQTRNHTLVDFTSDSSIPFFDVHILFFTYIQYHIDPVVPQILNRKID